MTQVIDFIGGEYRNRTGVHGFAIRCVTTPPTRHPWCDLGVAELGGMLCVPRGAVNSEAGYCVFCGGCPEVAVH